MKRMKSRVLALLLSAAMVITMIPAEPVMAAGNDGTAAYSLQPGISDEEISSEENIGKDETEQGSTEPAEEPTEEPVEEPSEEEPTEEPAELPTEEPSQEPAEEPAETPTEEPAESPSQEPTQTPAEEVPSESPTKTPEEILPSESPTATPDELMPTETPTVTPLVKEGLLGESNDINSKMVGSDGVLYSGVEYLSVKTVRSLPDEAQDVYSEMCEVISGWKENDSDIYDIVISVNKNKELELSASIPMLKFFTSDVQEQFLDADLEKEDAVSDETEKEIESQEKSESEEDKSNETENTAQNKTEDKTEQDITVEDKTEQDITDAEKDDTEAGDSETADAENSNENVVDENSEEVSKTEDIISENECAISENEEFAAFYSLEEEVIEGEEFVELDTLIQNENHFRSQLSKNTLGAFEQELYDAGKSGIVKGGKNSFSCKSSTSINTLKQLGDIGSMVPFYDAISALINTYPNSFNFMDLGYNAYCRVQWKYSSGKYQYKVTIGKSKHYNKNLETSAKKKVNSLVAAANQYAADQYPQSPTYGIVKYFNDWICKNNYYNYVGTRGDAKSLKSKEYYYCHSCYGILLKGYGVCESYALSMSRLLDAAGIRNLYVTGDTSGGGHAWNYVQMPDGKWYMLDSTWNDDSEQPNQFFLSSADNYHRATGMRFIYGNAFSFETLSTSKYTYSSNAEASNMSAIKLDKTKIILKPKATGQLSVVLPNTQSNYYDKFAKTWSSSNTKVAKVNANGKITAGTVPGQAKITLKVAGQTRTCTVYVYQFTGLSFEKNKKNSLKYTYENENATFGTEDIFDVKITANQKNRYFAAKDIQNATASTTSALANPTATSNKKTVADVSSVSLSGDTITLKVQPKAVGTAKITVKFAGKSATYTVTVKQKLQTAWFDFSKVPSSVEYSGKAYKPAVLKSASAPKNVKYTVSYKNNTNAGTATITLKGTGSYCSTVTKTFTIKPKPITTAVFSSCTASVKYNGKAQAPSTKVKLGKKTLKVNKEYTIEYYKGSTKLSSAPAAVGQYTVRITGKGNYSGTVTTAKNFEIKPYSFDKVSVSCPTTVKYTGKVVNPVKVKIGKTVLTTSDYTITYYNAKTGAKLSSAPSVKGKYKAVITPKGANVVKGKKASVTKTFTIK